MTDPATGIAYRDRWELVFDQMRRRILSGQMPPGSRIRESDVAEEFGVSRGPVREAIRALAVAGLVVRSPRQPSYVAPVVASDVVEVYALRTAIEVLAVRESMAHGAAQLAATLPGRVSAFESTRHASLDNVEIVEADIAFHTCFYEAAGNSRVLAVWNSITDPLRSMMRLATLRDDPHWRTSYEYHAEIAQAALAGDVDRAVDFTLQHLEAGRDDLLRLVGGGRG